VVEVGSSARAGALGWNSFGLVLVLLAAGHAVATVAVIREDRLWGELRHHWRGEADQVRVQAGLRRTPGPREESTGVGRPTKPVS
jgi:hypothetical protein